MNLHSHDWGAILTELEAVRCDEFPVGISNAEVARQLETTRSAVYGWKAKDAEPSHYNGERLIAMRNKYCVVANISPQEQQNVA